MEVDQNNGIVGKRSKAGTLLFVADFINGGQDVLEFACNLAGRYDHLELMHVIDPQHSFSMPDAEMGAQFNLELLSQRLRILKTSVVSLLSFGCPEDVIPRRAAEVKASLIVFPLIGSAKDSNREKLISRLTSKCNCPVLSFPLAKRNDENAESAKVYGSSAMIRKQGKPAPQQKRASIDFKETNVSMLRGA